MNQVVTFDIEKYKGLKITNKLKKEIVCDIEKQLLDKLAIADYYTSTFKFDFISMENGMINFSILRNGYCGQEEIQIPLY